MPTVPVVVVGAGPAGLAVSHELGVRGVDHVVLDRGRTARELAVAPLGQPAPAQPRLGDPAARAAAGRRPRRLPHRDGPRHPPRALRRGLRGARRRARRGALRARAAVTATASSAPPAPGPRAPSWSPPGTPACRRCRPWPPGCRPRPPAGVRRLPPPGAAARRWRPRGGGVGVRGAARRRARLGGRDVVLAVGRHTRMVRTHRGVDVYRWMERLGSLDRRSTGSPTPPPPCASRPSSSPATPAARRTRATSASPPSRPAASGSRAG